MTGAMAWVLALSGLVLPLVVARAEAQDADIRAFPLAIVCESSGIPHVFYLSKLQKDGVAVYLRPDGVMGTVSLSGPAAVVGGDEKGSCGGKTLEEIRAAGQTVEFPR